MRLETATDFFEWVDHLALPHTEAKALAGAGFVRDASAETSGGEAAYRLPSTTLPSVLLSPSAKASTRVALRPEFVADFIGAHNLAAAPEGEPYSQYRKVLVAQEDRTRLEAIERRAYRGFLTTPLRRGETAHIVKARELWRIRRRRCETDPAGFVEANSVLDEVLDLVDRDQACQFFFEVERAYWESRNRAGRIQKHRQDRLGLGWGNHDHHTFRCSRRHFADLIAFLTRLGFEKRERFYAGAEAGWGAQVLEHAVTGVVVFADVDLTPEETDIDFTTKPLPPRKELGTVGLWVGLHGESLLEAGMHHLEARFDFELLRDQLKAEGVATMPPFSDFDFLRQAFTAGERWPVQEQRLRRLLKDRCISSSQCAQFLASGALGSHLENLQRHGGFKGFNQKAVSAVIAATDPRKHPFHA
jgi:hypothetical protein